MLEYYKIKTDFMFEQLPRRETEEEKEILEARLSRIHLMKEISVVSINDVRKEIPSGEVITLDYTLKELNEELKSDKKTEERQWKEIRTNDGTLLGFFQNSSKGIIWNFDHHSNRREFFRQFSTTNAVIAYLAEHDIPKGEILIHHTDCDSMLSSLIISGLLPPENRFGQAAIAADHTGEPNAIADLLGALSEKRDPNFSYTELLKLLEEKPLSQEAEILLEKRLQEREIARRITFTEIPGTGVYWARSPRKIDSVFAPSLLPQAKIIILGTPMPGEPQDNPNLWEIKVRTGNQFPSGMSLQDFGLDSFGGRWNAGATKRHGGSKMNPEMYAHHVAEKFTEKLKKNY